MRYGRPVHLDVCFVRERLGSVVEDRIEKEEKFKRKNQKKNF